MRELHITPWSVAASLSVLLAACAVLVSACTGQAVQPTRRVVEDGGGGQPLPILAPTETALLAPAASCTDPAKAQAVAVKFLQTYNEGKQADVMAMLSPRLRQYLDASQSFQATGSNLPDLEGNFARQFAAHDNLAALQVNASTEATQKLAEYAIKIPDVTRTSDALKLRKATEKGQIEMGVECESLLLSIVAIETR